MEFIQTYLPLEKCAGEKLAGIIEENSNNPVLLMCSGGSALKMLSHVDVQHSDLTLTVLDERHAVSEEDNNFSQLMKTSLFRDEHIDARVQNEESLEETASRFGMEIRGWMEKNKNGVVIATIGIGEDGHTAGIFPDENVSRFNSLFEDTEKLVVGYEVPEEVNKFTKRITTTFYFLREFVDTSIVYVEGEGKKEALDRVLSDKGNLNETPARIIRYMNNVYIVSDII